MPNKHLSFAEYTEKWDKDPDTMKQKTEKAAKYAEELLRCKPHLIKNNRKDLAAELEKYCSAVIETSRPPEAFKTSDSKREWEKKQDSLEELGSFYNKNRAVLDTALKISELKIDESEYLDEFKPNSQPKQPEYEGGFRDLFRMLIDALCDAFDHHYPEIEYRNKARQQMKHDKNKIERSIFQKETEKERNRRMDENAALHPDNTADDKNILDELLKATEKKSAKNDAQKQEQPIPKDAENKKENNKKELNPEQPKKEVIPPKEEKKDAHPQKEKNHNKENIKPQIDNINAENTARKTVGSPSVERRISIFADKNQTRRTVGASSDKKNALEQTNKRKDPKQKVQETADLDSTSYIKNIQSKTNPSKDELSHCAAALIAIHILQTSQKKDQKNISPSQKEFDDSIKKILETQAFKDCIQGYGDLSKPDNAKKLQDELTSDKAASNLYAQYIQQANIGRNTQIEHNKIKEQYKEKHKEAEKKADRRLSAPNPLQK